MSNFELSPSDIATDVNGNPLMLDGVPVTQDPSRFVGEPAGFFNEVPPVIVETPEESEARDREIEITDARKHYDKVMKEAYAKGYRP